MEKLLYICSLLVCLFFTKMVHPQVFKAAVVEYSPMYDKYPVIPEVRLMRNVANYKKLALQSPNDYDIIVFPESTLYTGNVFKTATDIFSYSTIVPDPTKHVVPCVTSYTYASFLKEFSCLAKEINKFIVINLAENVPCEDRKNCSKYGYDVYNTNVVFNGEGEVVARYRKFNLFGEVYMTKPNLETITFDLKPNIKVGIFTCFDLIFGQPAIDLVKKKEVQAVVFPLMWYSELPFLTALQSQQQWARELNVILLAAGANNPRVGSGGSGIYQGNKGFKGVLKASATSRVLYSNIDTDEIEESETYYESFDMKAKKMDDFYLMKENLSGYSTTILDPTVRTFEAQVCNGKPTNTLCCDFTVETTVDENILNDKNNHYQYHLVAFSGVRSFSGVASGGIETCAVIACTNKSITSCGERFYDYNSISWPLRFNKIEVKAKFVKDEKRIQFPNSLLSNIHPLPIESSEWVPPTIDENTVERKHILTEPQDRLLTFGIFGRDFNRDGQEPTVPTPEGEESSGPFAENIPGRSSTLQLNFAAITAICILFLTNMCSV